MFDNYKNTLASQFTKENIARLLSPEYRPSVKVNLHPQLKKFSNRTINRDDLIAATRKAMKDVREGTA